MTEAPDYAAIYRLLGVGPDDGWDRVQKAYRRQVQVLHPDKAAGDPAREAQLRIKFEELNRGFELLRSFYRSFGALPPIRPDVPGRRRRRSYKPPPPDSPQQRPGRARRPAYLWLLLPLLMALIFWLMSAADGDYVGISSGRVPPAARELPDPGTSPGTLERGDRIGEVIDLLGRPDDVVDGQWLYGDATVTIDAGRVVDWRQGIRYRLPAGPVEMGGHLLNAPVVPSGGAFGLGASKTIVAQVQGPPVRAEESVWDYGISKVYFRDGRVIGWFNSPLDPLRVMPPE